MSPTPGIWAMALGSTPDERRAPTASEAICSPNSDASIFSSSSKASSLTGFPLAGLSWDIVWAVWTVWAQSLTALWSHPFLCRGHVPFADGVPTAVGFLSVDAVSSLCRPDIRSEELG